MDIYLVQLNRVKSKNLLIFKMRHTSTKVINVNAKMSLFHLITRALFDGNSRRGFSDTDH